MSKVKILIAAAVALVVLVVGGTWVYINVIKDDAPEKLAFDTTTTTVAKPDDTAATDDTTATTAMPGAAPTDGVDGSWTVTDGSSVGYRVKEVLFGQDTEGVGRTDQVTGSLTIEGTAVPQAEFEVDMASIESDESMRDNQFRGRIMDTEQFPAATFTLTSPIDLGAVPTDGAEVSVTATGDLTLRGVTKSVELPLTAKLSGDTFQVLGEYTIVYDDWEIPNPSGGPASVGDDGLLELLVIFAKG